jgi:transcription elongation factor GreB
LGLTPQKKLWRARRGEVCLRANGLNCRVISANAMGHVIHRDHEINMKNDLINKTDSSDVDGPTLPPVPVGARNYITPEGYARHRQELLLLIDVERPKVVEIVHWAASNGDRSENGDYIYGKKRLREIDRKIRFMTQRLELMAIVDPAIHYGSHQVFFGATVDYLEMSGIERTVTILGVDEVDSAMAQVSWVSPIARTLLKSHVGDSLQLLTPSGVVEIEVVGVRYPKSARSI